MAVLTDFDIKARLAKGDLKVEPLEDLDMQVRPCSVDVRLANEFRVFKHSKKAVIDPIKDHESLNDYTELIVLDDSTPFIIHPGEFVLGRTVEKVTIPNDLVARLEGRSSLGRLAIIIHSTAGYIDSGFEGTITLEIVNLGKMPVALYPKQRIGQLAFETTVSPAEKPYGHPDRKSKYQNQVLPEASRVNLDSENRARSVKVRK
ncbi:MAG TPA: dCTP deaminase [archaeon]|nr:dCTP deaminase [archaeon]